MKKYLLVALFLMPSVSSAATLTHNQVSAILSLLRAFNVPQATIQAVEADLEPPVAPEVPPAFSVSLDKAAYSVDPNGGVDAVFLLTPSASAYVTLNLYENNSMLGTYYPRIQYESGQIAITIPSVDPCQSYSYTIKIEHGGSLVTKSGTLPPEVCVKK